MKINFIDLPGQYQQIKEEVLTEIHKVLDSGQYILGKAITDLEKQFAEYIGVKHAIACSSGTDALLIALMSLDIKPGDEVITTPFTFIATAEVIALLNAKPVFVDIEEDTFNIDPKKIEAAVTSKTKVILPVHLYGQISEMDNINKIAKKHNLKVIEDACQAFGSEYKGKMAGNLAEIGCFSFFPSKNLGCYGDGGMISTNDDKLARKIRLIANHGSEKRYEHEIIGINGRLDTIQAAVLLAKMKHIRQWIEDRSKKGEIYTKKLTGIPGITPPIKRKENKHTYGQFTIRCKQRTELQKFMTENEIPTAVHYPKPLDIQPAFKDLGYKKGDFPNSETASEEVISLPFFPEITETQMDLVVNTVKEFVLSKVKA
ncbi:MAG: DegT/DnrJ/EryC1/StrS family aminotransferase [Candidatus Margulisbacteria bacterium]|nr:DegT/DnrJ/EryC1/StrS family aminotransferase [Candidatus Margulisiibacteriota bacterium]